MYLALNKLRRLICNKNQPTIQLTTSICCRYLSLYITAVQRKTWFLCCTCILEREEWRISRVALGQVWTQSLDRPCGYLRCFMKDRMSELERNCSLIRWLFLYLSDHLSCSERASHWSRRTNANVAYLSIGIRLVDLCVFAYRPDIIASSPLPAYFFPLLLHFV